MVRQFTARESARTVKLEVTERYCSKDFWGIVIVPRISGPKRAGKPERQFDLAQHFRLGKSTLTGWEARSPDLPAGAIAVTVTVPRNWQAEWRHSASLPEEPNPDVGRPYRCLSILRKRIQSVPQAQWLAAGSESGCGSRAGRIRAIRWSLWSRLPGQGGDCRRAPTRSKAGCGNRLSDEGLRLTQSGITNLNRDLDPETSTSSSASMLGQKSMEPTWNAGESARPRRGRRPSCTPGRAAANILSRYHDMQVIVPLAVALPGLRFGMKATLNLRFWDKTPKKQYYLKKKADAEANK